MIEKFEGVHEFLSNFYKVDPPLHITYNGIDSIGKGELTADTSEALYQAGKSKNPASYAGIHAGQAKRQGRKEAMTEQEKQDWDGWKKKMLMKRILLLKFDKNHPDLQKKLLLTGSQEIVEGNDWNDVYWGVCDGYGENNLGNLLMEIRRNLKDHPENLHPEVREWLCSENVPAHIACTKVNPSIYISGPMTVDLDNFDQHFQDVEDALSKLGWAPVNPAKDKTVDFPESVRWTNNAWKEYIKRDVDLVSQCDAICLIKGWEKSKGAMVELVTAYKYDLLVVMELEDGTFTVPRKISELNLNLSLGEEVAGPSAVGVALGAGL